MADIKLGTYRHFKGGMYRVIGTAKHSEDGSEMVIYHSLDTNDTDTEAQTLWARPAQMWNDIITLDDGTEVKRFEQDYSFSDVRKILDIK